MDEENVDVICAWCGTMNARVPYLQDQIDFNCSHCGNKNRIVNRYPPRAVGISYGKTACTCECCR